MTMEAPFTSAGPTILSERHPHAPTRAEAATVEIGLSAALVTVRKDEPEVLTVRGSTWAKPHQPGSSPGYSLPNGPFSPRDHRTMEAGLREWVSDQTGIAFGYAEQLYTFADRGRHARADDTSPHVVSIGYLALVRPGANDEENSTTTRWRGWYEFFPWEDWRSGKPAILKDVVEPFLARWVERGEGAGVPNRPMSRKDRVRIAFGTENGAWDEEKVLERYELLYEAGLVGEAKRDGRQSADDWNEDVQSKFGVPLMHDHRRILATAIGRVRAKIKYRPVVFELMPNEFTLFELQKTVEAILGPHLHKQNFRRLVESAGLVEQTNEVRVKTGGRPARLYRFRQEVVLERPAPGVRINTNRN